MDEPASLDRILDSARRAQQAIGSIELARIEAHDPDELRKLDVTLAVLDELVASMNAESEDATVTSSADTRAPDGKASEAGERDAAIVDGALRRRAGISQRLGHIFMPGRADPFVAVADLPHREGLPTFEKCVAPDDSPINGAHGIFVTNSSVFTAVLPRPFASNGWQVLHVVRCDNPRTIIQAVMNLLTKPGSDTIR